jgi:Na+-translocating ferredoxin:NAD+ oxidoreductase subunit B
MTQHLIKQVDSLLPQTQCELCTYKGCLPYAKAMVEDGESIDLCLPGGVRVLETLGEFFDKDVSLLKPEMVEKQKQASVVSVRESECIGCTKCIQACPVDAIVGAPKKMHTVITDACNGCELCIPPCPVDCIDIESVPPRLIDEELSLVAQSRQRFEARKQRIELQQQRERNQHLLAKKSAGEKTAAARRKAIEEIMQRKKNN